MWRTISDMRIYFIVFILVSISFTLVSCNFERKVKQLGFDDNIIIKCNAEKWEDQKFLDETGLYELSNANGRTTEESRSGSYSLKLTKENRYGMTIVLHNINSDDYFRISAWQKGNGSICASDDIPDSFFLAAQNPVETDSAGWQRLTLEFYVPYDYKKSEIKILLANFGEQPVYFDDLIIIKESERTFPEFENDQLLNIFVSEANYQKISHKREEAFSDGLLMTESDDWAKAILFYNNDVLDAKIRLKGDRLDHLQGKKWSFRINLKGESSWKRMTTFSVQTPKARNFMHEWFFHKALEKEDLLCTRYGFIPVALNGKSLGVYAWEEHFEKHLVEYRNRREGPILKLTDDSYWIDDKIRREREVDFSVPSYDASVIEPFDDNNIEDSLLLKEFRYARDLYQQYKYAKAQASDIFDIDAIARYYAMTDATNAYHTLHFFNQRFYYNPIIGKLEPIFFDSFADVGVFDYYGYNLIVENAKNAEVSVHLKMFADPKFRKLYFQYLDKYTSLIFWRNLYQEYKSEADSINKLLNTEFPDYHFKIESFYEVAEKARKSMESVKKEIENVDLFSKFKTNTLKVNSGYKGKADFEILPHLINVYTQNNQTFRVENYTTDTITITGLSDIPQLQMEKFDEPVELPPANSGASYIENITSETQGNKFLFAKIRNKKINIPVIPWSAPDDPNYLEIRHAFDTLKVRQKYKAQLKNDSIIFSGNISIDENLVIPADKIVIFDEGTQFDLTNNATFISYSTVFVKGTKTEPVLFTSSDNTGRGINVFQASERSVVKNAVFTGLTNLKFGGWFTTTAVCFYESDVDFHNVRFEKNIGCDDALNVVRSDFYMEGCVFEDTFSDAFDSDFCNGYILNTLFNRAGNDALDCSGSMVEAVDCTITNAGDKGVSGGENSQITLTGCVINGANIGVASKDLSTVKIKNSNLSNVTYGLVAFQKKPEYGPAKIISENVLVKKDLFLHAIEEESILTFNNRKIFGQERNLSNRFY